MSKIILEAKSISDVVVKIGNKVGNTIINDVGKKKVKISKYNMAKFIDGELSIKVSKFLKSGDTIKVNYIIYLADTVEKYDAIIQGLRGEANSEADPDTNTIKIVSGFINGKPTDDFWQTIYHELEHLYQYGMGMQKRETLYDRMRELIGRGKNDINGYYVGLCCYYTFKHEQDAFVHQFYAMLTKTEGGKSFNECLKMFSPYKSMDYAYGVLVDNQDNPKIMTAINYLGYKRKQFISLVGYRFERLYNKLCNAYKRYLSDNDTLNESSIDRYIKRMEIYETECKKLGYNIEWVYEDIYNF